MFLELCGKITLLRSKKKILTEVCNVVYFRLCIDLLHITPPVTAEGLTWDMLGYDGSNHLRYAKCLYTLCSGN